MWFLYILGRQLISSAELDTCTLKKSRQILEGSFLMEMVIEVVYAPH